MPLLYDPIVWFDVYYFFPRLIERFECAKNAQQMLIAKKKKKKHLLLTCLVSETSHNSLNQAKIKIRTETHTELCVCERILFAIKH